MTPTVRTAGRTAKLLPQFAVQASPPDFFDHDGVRVAQDLGSLRCDLADDAHRPGRARETAGATRCPWGRPSSSPTARNLVFEQESERFDQIERQIVR